MATTKTPFEVLSSINVNDKVEKKNGLSYLSWAWAWAVVKQNFPTATYKVYENADGFNYHHDGLTAWVKVGVTIADIEHIEYLPVMNHRNKSIPVTEITSFDVNSSIQRGLTKAIARHGLGLYIYAGEDLPQEVAGSTAQVEEAAPKEEKVPTHIELNIGDKNWDKVMRYVVANKDKGLAEIAKALSTKYILSSQVKKELSKAIK